MKNYVLLLVLAVTAGAASDASGQRPLTDYKTVSGKLSKDSPMYDGRYTNYYRLAASPGEKVLITITTSDFTPNIFIPLHSFVEMTCETCKPTRYTLRSGQYMGLTVPPEGELEFAVSTEHPGQTGSYQIKRMKSSSDVIGPEEEAQMSNIRGLHLGANLHNAHAQLAGDDFGLSGSGHTLRAALGMTEFLVLSGEMHTAMVEADADAPPGTFEGSWDLKDYEIGARLYLFGPSSSFRPYVGGAYGIREIGVRTDGGYKGTGTTASAGLEFFFLRSFALELGGSYAMSKFDRFFSEGREGDLSELDLEPFEMTQRRLSFGVTWHSF